MCDLAMRKGTTWNFLVAQCQLCDIANGVVIFFMHLGRYIHSLKSEFLIVCVHNYSYTIYNEKYLSDGHFSYIVCVLTWRA